jgi:hypothetical protein
MAAMKIMDLRVAIVLLPSTLPSRFDRPSSTTVFQQRTQTIPIRGRYQTIAASDTEFATSVTDNEAP